jgi:regulator of replication initiation timing
MDKNTFTQTMVDNIRLLHENESLRNKNSELAKENVVLHKRARELKNYIDELELIFKQAYRIGD